jgi:alpha-L-rhamnosidase
MLKPNDLRCEYRLNPVGIDIAKPRLFWKLASEERNVMQGAYQVHVASSEKKLLAGTLIWDSGKTDSDRSIHIVYDGPALLSRQICHWRIRIWDDRGREGDWSEPAFWEMGLLGPPEWTAQMVAPRIRKDKKTSGPCPMLRREFSIEKPFLSARLYITALGLYEARINGIKVGDELFTPGWTPYHSCLQYQTYDVTDFLKEGPNTVGAILADGWYRGYISYSYDRNVYGDTLSLLAQLEIVYIDGSVGRIVSDGSWKCTTGALLSSDIFNGETFDAMQDLPGWDCARFDDSSWQGVTPVVFNTSILAAQRGEPVKAIEKIRPVAIFKTPKGETVIDFGQNMTGWIRLKARGERGTEITLRHGEVLDQQGNFYDKNLRMAKATDRFILAGTGTDEVFEPRFTFHGFRYALVEGYTGELTADRVSCVVIHSDIKRTGDFSCSNDLVNRLYKNIVWSQRGNFLDVPTDCPQRDERMGWTGDIQVFAETACLNMDSAAFLARWLRDLRFDQKKSGAVPMVIPDTYFDKMKTLTRIISHIVFRREGDEKDFFDEFFALFVLNHSAAWGDAAVIVPWRLYQAYGDKCVLEDQYESMQSLFCYHMKRSGGLSSLLLMSPIKWFQLNTWKYLKYYYTSRIGFGDWLAPEDGMDKSIFKSMFYIPTVYMALDALILSKAAEIIGKKDDAAYYSSMYGKIRDAYRHFKIRKDGRLRPHRQTAYVLALMAGLIPEEERGKAADILAEMVRDNDYRLGTGFLGTPSICSILCEYGYVDEAYRLLLNEEHQWLYQVTKGATTIWEHWDAIRPDGSYQPARMLSFNHYAYGAIGAWLFKDVAGINHDDELPGYKKIIIRPRPGGGLTWAKAQFESLHGIIKSGWKLLNDELVLSVVIPPNAKAVVFFPSEYPVVSEKGHEILYDSFSIEIGSGVYEFVCSKGTM